MITKLKRSILYKLKLKVTTEAISGLKIHSPIRNQKYHFAKNNYDHLRNINLLKHSEEDSTSIDLLTQNDFYYSFINGNIVKGKKDETIAIETYLAGFILSGIFIDENSKKETSINFNSIHALRIAAEDNFINDYKEEKCVHQDELKGQLNKFWETESVGINNYFEDYKVIKRFNSARYYVKRPFTKHHEILSTR